jgi:hypothetical protein
VKPANFKMASWLQMHALPGSNVNITGPCKNFYRSVLRNEKALPNIKEGVATGQLTVFQTAAVSWRFYDSFSSCFFVIL